MKIKNADILVVDDERGMREGIQRLLGLKGLNVDTAESGSEGIEKGISKEYDLYFIDLKIPDIEGTQVLREIKLAYPEAICVILTAYASIETAIETTQLGAYQYIPKPFDPEELQNLVNRALEKRWYVLEARQLREEREKRLLELQHEQSRVRSIVNALDDGVVVINVDGQVVFHNSSFLKMLNVPNDFQTGEQVWDIVPGELHDQIKEVMAQQDDFRAIKQEITIKPPAELVLMANTTPIVDTDHELIGVVSVLRDISELKKLDILKSQFVNMAAHELKAPLAAVQGYLDLIIDRSLGDNLDSYQTYLERSHDRLEALISMINDLLNISRMEAGKVRREIEQVDLAGLLKDKIELFTKEIKQKNLQLDIRLQKDFMVKCDREEIERVFNNLISNAVKYNKENGTISIKAGKDGHYAKVSVSDTGIGLQPDEKDRLFEEFYRAKNKFTRKITGTGLGLSIVKRIIDANAGKIIVESEFEKGTTFTVFLPLETEY
ncbi:MAG: response regulator [candidate division KSB1 bacterium]|nr:response regulator [candidate division KSB1 bacterium]